MAWLAGLTGLSSQTDLSALNGLAGLTDLSALNGLAPCDTASMYEKNTFFSVKPVQNDGCSSQNDRCNQDNK